MKTSMHADIAESVKKIGCMFFFKYKNSYVLQVKIVHQWGKKCN